MEEKIIKLLNEGKPIADALKIASEEHYNAEKTKLEEELKALEEKEKNTSKAINDFLNVIGLTNNVVSEKANELDRDKLEEQEQSKEVDEVKENTEAASIPEPVIENEQVIDDMQIYSVDQLINKIKELNPNVNIEYNNKVFEPGIIIETDVNNLVLPDNFFYDNNLGITNSQNAGYPISIKVETKEKENKTNELEAMDKDLADSIDRFNNLKAETYNYNFELPSADELEKTEEVKTDNNVVTEEDTMTQMPTAEELITETQEKTEETAEKTTEEVETEEETKEEEKIEEVAEQPVAEVQENKVTFSDDILNKINKESKLGTGRKKVEKIQNAVLKPDLTATLEAGAIVAQGASVAVNNNTVPDLLVTAGIKDAINNLAKKLNSEVNITGSPVEVLEQGIKATPSLLRAYATKANGAVQEEKKEVEQAPVENVANNADSTFTESIENQLNEELQPANIGGR